MKRPLLSCAIIFGAFLLVGIDQGFADTIFRVDSMGKEAMVADGVIVWDVYRFRNDPPSRVHYYYWDARACYLADMWEDFDTEKNERCRVVYSEKEQRAEIVNSIRAKGLHAKITDQVNVSADCHLFRLEYGPPTGYYYILGGAPAGEDRLPFKAKDKPQIERIPFSILKTIEFGAKDDIRILLGMGNEC